MRAIVLDRSGEPRFVLGETPEIAPLAHEAVVRVEAISLNPGEVRMSMATAPDGASIGADFAGVVERRAANGQGPAEGERVFGISKSGAWRERVAVPVSALANLPSSVSATTAAALPVAGMTALVALQEGGLLLGKSVLVNGASGGVGHLAVQLAHRAGARVTAAVRRDEHIKNARSDGADEVVVTAALEEARHAAPYDVILDSVGGEALGAALTMIADGGVCVTYGNSTHEPATFNPMQFFHPRSNVRFVGFFLWPVLDRNPPSGFLGRLARLAESGALRPRSDLIAPWEDVTEVVARFQRRELSGKVVLTTGV
jgi:NADPH:quinone reductase-like Zn-dependent oxidoreductase